MIPVSLSIPHCTLTFPNHFPRLSRILPGAEPARAAFGAAQAARELVFPCWSWLKLHPALLGFRTGLTLMSDTSISREGEAQAQGGAPFSPPRYLWASGLSAGLCSRQVLRWKEFVPCSWCPWNESCSNSQLFFPLSLIKRGFKGTGTRGKAIILLLNFTSTSLTGLLLPPPERLESINFNFFKSKPSLFALSQVKHSLI